MSQRAFFFDLDPWADETPIDDPQQPLGTDAETLTQLLTTTYHLNAGQRMLDVGGFPPWAFKYTNFQGAGGTHGGVATEWHYALTLSGLNAFMEADALGYSSICNASFTHHFPLKSTYPQPAAPDRAALIQRGLLAADGTVPARRYFAFYVGDFDSPAWLYHMLPTLWQDSARGQVPLSWAFDPNLCLRAAPAMAWARATASPEDTFIAGDSGAGYLNPGALETPRPSGLPSGMAVWAKHCHRFYTQWDIRVTGFVIEGNAAPMRASGLDAYSGFSPGGTVGQDLPAQGALYDHMPVLLMPLDIQGTPSQAAAAIGGLQSGLLPQFTVARGVLESPSWYRSVAAEVAAGTQGPPTTVVDMVTLMALLAIYLEGPATGGG